MSERLDTLTGDFDADAAEWLARVDAGIETGDDFHPSWVREGAKLLREAVRRLSLAAAGLLKKGEEHEQ